MNFNIAVEIAIFPDIPTFSIPFKYIIIFENIKFDTLLTNNSKAADSNRSPPLL